jgi:DNA helicase IV
MATDPGDLVLDPTCGSGTIAFVAEQWGRRWITIDTSLVALALARTRLMAARYPWYLLTDSREGRAKEAELTQRLPADTPVLVHERVPHITLKSIATSADALAQRALKSFDHVVIDEAQDLAPAELKFFAPLAPAKANGLFLSGDVGQRIFQHPFSWASLGVDVRGRSQTLKVCYRTSQQIRRAADRLLPTILRDTDVRISGRFPRMTSRQSSKIEKRSMKK